MPAEPSRDQATIGDALIFIVKALLAVGAIVLVVTAATIWWSIYQSSRLNQRLHETRVEELESKALDWEMEALLIEHQADQQRAMAESMRDQIAACLDEPCGCGPVLEDISRQLTTMAQPPD